ncbi:MAG: T9SS type A sorting domain-containing protein, partial [Calditrichaeota bacterium]|nr:T9SS type A sorting domain-containing protein [Calditrichota bacterium]
QLAEIQAVTAGGALTYPKVEISAAEQAHILDAPTEPLKMALKAYPNPFNASTRITFSLLQSTRTQVRVYDVRGRLVATLVNANLPAGNHSVVWHSTDQRGNPVPSGIYICRLEAGGERLTRKILLVR